MYAPRYFPKRYFAGRYFPPVTSGGFTGWTETTSGGISFSGVAALSNTFAEPVTGGLLFGGDAAVSHTYAEQTSGGVVFGGDAVVQWIPGGGGGFVRRLWYRLGLGV
jgi:hypothetical protein